MNNIKVRQGAQLNLRITQGDEDSISATVILRPQGGGSLIQQTAVFASGEAVVEFDGDDTAVLGVYDYQINENFAAADPLKYPDPNDCDDDECEFPTITICEALDV